jgi:hypothetical protein
MKPNLTKSGCVVCLATLLAACEPASLTEARNQLGRGGERVVAYVLPVIVDSVKVQDMVDTVETTLDTTGTGLLAIRSDPESLTVDLGADLIFENIALDGFVVDVPIVDPNVPVGTQLPIPTTTFSALDSDMVLEGVDTVLVHSGMLVVTTRNRLPATVAYTVTIDGFLDAGGSALTAVGTLPASLTGLYVSDVLSFDLAGVKVVPATASVQIGGTATVVSSPVNQALGTAAVTQDGAIATVEIASVSGPLDPVANPELKVAVEQPREFLRTDFDFGDFEEAAEASTLNDATIVMEVTNSAAAPAVLSGFAMGVVTLDASGNIPRDVDGNPVYEVDSQGRPILVPVADPGLSTLTLARSSIKIVQLQGASLADRLFHLLLADERAAIVTAGAAEIGDGAQSRIDRTDTLGVVFDVTVGFDLTVPDTGVVISRYSDNEGLDFDPREADSVVARIISPVEFTAEVVNETAFGTGIDVAFVRGVLPEDADVFNWPGSVIIPTVTLSVPSVDSQGRVSQPVTDTVVVQLNNDDVREVLDSAFTAQARIRLLPGTGGGGRAAVYAADAVLIDAQVKIQLRAGKPQ